MRKCVKILSQFNRGSSYIHRYVGLCPMFNVEVMNADAELVLVYQGAKLRPSNVARGLTSIFKEITETVRKEAATIADVFPSLNDVMSILVQRVLEDRVAKLLEKLLLKPSLVSPPTMKGGLVLYLRLLVMAYEQTKELARDLRDVGCGDLDVEGLTESLFLPHKDMYIEYEQASLRQLYKSKMEELRTEVQQSSESSGTIGCCASASMASCHQQICPAAIAANVSIVFTCLLDQVERNLNVHRYPLISSTFRRLEFMHGSFSTELPCIGKVSTYITEGLDRARDSLTAAAAIRGKFVLGTSVSRRVADAAASTAEAVAAAGDSSFRSFMVSVQRCGSCVAFVQKYFTNSVSRLLLPVDGVHAASCEELATVMSSVDSAAYKGLQQCIEIVMAEVEHVLSTEQKVRDYRSPDDGIAPVHRPTLACSKVVFYLSRVLYLTLTAVQGLNKQAFLTELGNRLHEGLLNHWQKFSFNASGGLRLKCDITKYAEFVRSFNVPCVDEKFEQPGILLMLLLLKVSSLREPDEHEVHSASRGLQESKTCSEALVRTKIHQLLRLYCEGFSTYNLILNSKFTMKISADIQKGSNQQDQKIHHYFPYFKEKMFLGSFFYLN